MIANIEVVIPAKACLPDRQTGIQINRLNLYSGFRIKCGMTQIKYFNKLITKVSYHMG